jgi:hypothetical protein
MKYMEFIKAHKIAFAFLAFLIVVFIIGVIITIVLVTKSKSWTDFNGLSWGAIPGSAGQFNVASLDACKTACTNTSGCTAIVYTGQNYSNPQLATGSYNCYTLQGNSGNPTISNPNVQSSVYS